MHIAKLVFVTVIVAGATGASARTLPLMGGPGGGTSTLRCPAGQHLVGLKARAGLWMDNIQIECARLGRAGAALRHADRRLHGSAGGAGGGAGPVKTCFDGRAIGSLGTQIFFEQDESDPVR